MTKILIVDEPELREEYGHLMRLQDHEVILASSGEECLELAAIHLPDLVVLDVALSNASGQDICRRLKTNPSLHGVFVLHVSAHASPESTVGALEAGADGFLSKPIDPRVLVAQVRALLRIKVAEDDLRQANRRLHEFNRLKAEFVANMSHELRTPLTAVIGFAQLMQMEASGQDLKPSIGDGLERILRNGRHLLTLVDDVLDFSKLEAGRMRVHSEVFDLVETVQSTFGELISLAAQKGLIYHLAVEDEFPLANTDMLRVRQIFINLLSNALKFTDKGRVEARLSRIDERRFRLSVQDTGIGISPSSLEFVFDRFRQVDGSSTRRAGGIGLGLAISHELAVALGGGISVRSTPGEGSTFTLELPLTLPNAGGAEHGFSSRSASTISWAATAESTNGNPLVLIVEDDPDAGDFLTTVLRREGFRTRLATDGALALTMARELLPSAITLDIMMPGVDGWRVLHSLKEDSATAGIPVVVCSIVDNRPLGYRLGASDYLIKPVAPEKLVAAMNRVGAIFLEGDGGYVLIVDDEHGVRELMATALRKAGYETRTAASGEVALAMIHERAPSALLCDLALPGGMSGFELIARLRSHPGLHSFPVVIVTGKDITEHDRKLLTGQIAEVIRKGDLLMSDLQTRLKETLEEIGVKPQ